MWTENEMLIVATVGILVSFALGRLIGRTGWLVRTKPGRADEAEALKAQIAYLETSVKHLYNVDVVRRDSMYGLFARVRKMEDSYVSTESLLEGMGGVIWQTATGHRRGIAFLSDSHLQNIIDGGFGGPSARKAVRAEQARRKEDAEWRAKDDITKTEGSRFVDRGRATASRPVGHSVGKLPKWAQEIIRDMEQGRRMGILTAEERERVFKLPNWASAYIGQLTLPVQR